MKPDKHLAAAAAILIAAACLIALTWVGTNRSIEAETLANTASVNTMLANQALTLAERISRQILAIDQSLRFFAKAWQADPAGFNLEAWRRQAVGLNGLGRDLVLTDQAGIIRQSSVAEAVNQDASGTDYFRALAEPDDAGEQLYIGATSIDPIMRQWHMNVARALHHSDGSFAGTIDTDYRIAAIIGALGQLDLGAGSFAALVGLDDGKLRGAAGIGSVDSDASAEDTKMFSAITAADAGVWTGPSAIDAAPRVHAFHRVPNRRLVVVLAMSEAEAARPAEAWRQHAQLYAGGITALLAVLALSLVTAARLARRHHARLRQDRAALAAADAQVEVARALAATKADQLEATLTPMADGALLVDGHMCLVEWNPRFPELAGVPADALRTGMPMEELLRMQILHGEFGAVRDAEAEIGRRMARLTEASVGVSQHRRPDGRVLELRRSRLQDGGFVMLFTDVTDRLLAADAVREAEAAAATAAAENARIVSIVGRDIAPSLSALRDALGRFGASGIATEQRSLATAARNAGEELLCLLGKVSQPTQSNVGTLASRPAATAPQHDNAVRLPAPTGAAANGTIGRQAAPHRAQAPGEADVTPPELPLRVPRTRMLLAGDDVTRLRAMSEVLRRQGHYVDIAPAPAAIELVRTMPYDLVLMDISMSAMAGTQAARNIRELPEPARSVPIIALTDIVVPEEAATIHAEGIDGLLGRAVWQAELPDVLRDRVWASPPRSPSGSMIASPGFDPDNAEMQFHPVLLAERIGELRAILPPATFVNLIEECLVDMGNQLPALRRALAAGAPGAIIAHAHALVGMAAGYGMAALEQRLRSVISAARNGALGSLGSTIITDTERDFERAADGLRELLRSEMG